MVKQIFIFIITFTATILFCEVFFRTAHISNRSSSEFYDDIGRGCRKNYDYLYFNEGFGIGRYNEYRYIGEANPPEKPVNAFRVALMGDSYVESFQIFERDYFGNISETVLQKEYPNLNFEFLNFGRSGFDIADVYAYDKILVSKFNPDLTLYIIENDDLTPQYKDPLLPITVLKNDSLVISLDFDKEELKNYQNMKYLPQNSSIFQLINIDWKKYKTTSVSSVLFDKFYTLFTATPENQKIVINDKINPVAAEILNSLDPKKVIFVNRDNSELMLDFRISCRDKGFEIIDLNDVLTPMRSSGTDPNEWKVTGVKGHWNNNAHKTIGSYIAQRIKPYVENLYLK